MADTLTILPATIVGCEPEEAPAKRSIDFTSAVNLSGGLPEVVMKGGRPAIDFPNAIQVARINTPVTAEMPAGEVANLLRKRCATCLHFRNDLWRETKRIWAAAPERSSRRTTLDKMIVQYARACTDEAIPSLKSLKIAESEYNFFGVCGALSEERVDIVVIHPDACCPEGRDYYQPASREAQREASKKFDAIMRLAQGRS